MTTMQKILISRRMLVADTIPTKAAFKLEGAYLNAFLLSNFGIVVDKPELLTKEMVKDISDVYKLNVPKSYFANPQDTKFYTADELLIEQCISYFLAYGAEDSHVHIFDKELPEYPVGQEIKIREFKILDPDACRVKCLIGYSAYCLDMCAACYFGNYSPVKSVYFYLRRDDIRAYLTALSVHSDDGCRGLVTRAFYS